MARRQYDAPRTAYGRRIGSQADNHRTAATVNRNVATASAAGAGLSFMVGNVPVGAGLLTLAGMTADQSVKDQAAARALNAKGRSVEDLIARRQGWDLRSNVNRHNEPVRSFAMVKGVSETVAPTATTVSADKSSSFDPINRNRAPHYPGERGDPRVGPKESAAVRGLINAYHAIGSTQYQRALISAASKGDTAAGVIADHNRRRSASSSSSVDTLAYTAGSASVIAGGQMARDMRKSAANARGSRATRAGTDQSVLDAKAVADGSKARGVRKTAARSRVASGMRTPGAMPAAKAYQKMLRAPAPSPQPGMFGRASVALARANPFMMAAGGTVAASNAWNAARAMGGSKGQAALAAGTAAAPMAAAIAAPTLLGRYAPKAAAMVSKAALPLMALSTGIAAFRGGQAAWSRGESAAGIAAGAAMGAADSLTFGLASAVRDRLTGRTAGPDQAAAPAAMQADMAASGHAGAYINDAAKVKAASPSGPTRVAATAAAPSSDGMTAGYTRTDPRTGQTVTVKEYRTPGR